jgi:hypothetical protein
MPLPGLMSKISHLDGPATSSGSRIESNAEPTVESIPDGSCETSSNGIGGGLIGIPMRTRTLSVEATTKRNNLPERHEDCLDNDSETEIQPFDLPTRPPWEERGRHLSLSPKKKNVNALKTGTANEELLGRDHEFSTPNSVRRVRTNSRDSNSSSGVTFQLNQYQQETTSHYTDNTERNSHFMSESDEGFSFPSERQQQQVVEISTASASSGVTVASVALPDDQALLDPTAAFNFAMEHRIFLKASLDLLTELDRHAPELGMMDPIVLKAGVSESFDSRSDYLTVLLGSFMLRLSILHSARP